MLDIKGGMGNWFHIGNARHQHFKFTRVGRAIRALDGYADIVGAPRRRDLAAVEQGLRGHLRRFYGEIASLLPVQ